MMNPSGAAAVENAADDLQWYVVYSKAHKEETARMHLESKGLEVFFPRLLLPDSPRRRRRIMPLFPNYLFVRISFFRQSHYVLWTPGVKQLVSFYGAPAALDDDVVAFLVAQADEQSVIRVRPRFTVGQRVEITAGPLDGLSGILQEPPDSRGRVKVLANLLGRKIRVHLPVEFLHGGTLQVLPRNDRRPAATLIS